MISLALISGSALVSALVWLVVVGLVFWLLWWLLGYVNPPQPFMKVGQVILAVAAVLFLINFLMSLAGHPIVNW